jgi:hypothetical protein
MQFLKEYLDPRTANLTEMKKSGGDFYLSGIMMQAAMKNGNGRCYPINEIARAVTECQAKLDAGIYICGELNHPETLSINLANVSHAITEIRMDGDNAVGKMKLLNTPAGNIAKAIIEGGVRLGVSSRGTGNVNETGNVSDYSFVCMDIVSTPSAPDAYPSLVSEALGSRKVMTLAEAVVHDPKAQAYFKKEIQALMAAISKGSSR